MSRLLVAVVASACAAALVTGCATPAPSRPAGPSLAEVNTWGSDIGPNGEWPPDIPASLKVREPKDARGIGACDLLTPAQLRQVGLDPATARRDAEGYAEGCTWDYADGSSWASVGISTDPRASKLPSMYRVHHDEPAFQMFEIAGHPVLRFDPEPDRDCGLSIAVADLQNLGVGGTFDRTPRPDKCKQARLMAELILSNLPPLR